MESLLDQVSALGHWNWFIAGVALLALEMVVPGVHFMWFGIAALIMGGALLAMPMALPLQLIAFAVLALAIVLAVRRLLGPEHLKTDAPDLNVRGHSCVGRVVTVEEPIAGGRGKVRVGDTLWVAEGADAAVGTHVKVTGVNGTVLMVSMA